MNSFRKSWPEERHDKPAEQNHWRMRSGVSTCPVGRAALPASLRFAVGRKNVMRKKVIIIAAGLGLGVLLLIVSTRHHASSPEEENVAALARLRYAPVIKGFGGYFSRDYLAWNLQGRHSDSQVNQIKSQHEENLVASGYLQRQTFSSSVGNWRTTEQNCRRFSNSTGGPARPWA
jgi:ABC-type lipoprotein release transport system permease subunit